MSRSSSPGHHETMSCSFPITSLTSIANVETLQPLEDFPVFQQRPLHRAREYWWGLEPDELDFESLLNRVSVRADIACLLSKNALTLIPSQEVINVMQELALYNREHSVYERRRCFEVLPDQPYQYRLIPGRHIKDHQTPLFSFDPNSNTFQQFDYPYDDLPPFTLDCYPLHSVMHSSRAVLFSSANHAIVSLAVQWTYEYPRTGRFAKYPALPLVYPMKTLVALDETSDSSSSMDTDSESDDSVAAKEFIDRPLSPEHNAKAIVSWLKKIEPVSVSELKDPTICAPEPRTE